MSYAALMVHVDAGRAAEKRSRLAVGLANRFGAALIGVAGRSYLPTFLANGVAVNVGEGDSERRETAALLADLGQRFRAGAEHLEQVEWRGIVDYAASLIPQEARAADLLIVGRKPDPDDLYYALDPGIAIVRAGRPVLFVPDEIDTLEARRVVVAWKDTREARRAVGDALPFLKQAREVVIVTVCERGSEAECRKQIDDVETYLLRHEVTVGAKAYLRGERPIAIELLRFAKDERADLIVAGGYGHSRLGEWAFGGVTRDLLSSSPICCLFSH